MLPRSRSRAHLWHDLEEFMTASSRTASAQSAARPTSVVARTARPHVADASKVEVDASGGWDSPRLGERARARVLRHVDRVATARVSNHPARWVRLPARANSNSFGLARAKTRVFFSTVGGPLSTRRGPARWGSPERELSAEAEGEGCC